MKKAAFLLIVVCFQHQLSAVPAVISKYIKTDQFGYFPAARKVAVIVDPQNGYDAAESFSPGTGANQYQVRRWLDDAVVFTGTLVAWKAGITHAQSGDRGWWFDFSALTIAGSYYVYDLARNVGSYRFEIGDNVYAEVLKQASRMYFYQRVNFAKQPPYTDSKWADAAAFGGANQDFAARSRWDKNNPATARDLHGGWFDAGDCNKYVTFAATPVCYLLEAYRMYPALFGDNNNIPESGNTIPDILDEVKWELDWLTRMQDATGTNGLFLKVGADNYNSSSPPSTDNNPRYYVPECTSSTLTGALVFSLGSTVYKSLGNASMTTYGNNLLTRAVNAWNRARVTTSNFNVFETACDDQNIVAGDADADAPSQQELVIAAAAYLYEATGSSEYKNCFDTMYAKARPYSYYWWAPYYGNVERALLRYTQLPGATTAVKNNIRNVKAGQNYLCSIDDYNNATDLYRGSMPDAQYHWNSHEVKANAGINNYDFSYFDINTGSSSLYKETGESYLHWFHGVNPMGKVMLSNMYAYGGDNCVNEFYHSWFADGTVWDNVQTSLYGPPPGYVPGGPNKDFSINTISPPAGQPPLKSYKEWNTGWNTSTSSNENSWEITEAGIYTQAAYISLLVRAIGNNISGTIPVHLLELAATRRTGVIQLDWKATAADADRFEVERSTDGIHFDLIATVSAVAGNINYTTNDVDPVALSRLVYYRVKETSKTGQLFYSAIVKIYPPGKQSALQVYPNPFTNSFQVNAHADKDGPGSLQLYDANGRLVFQQQWEQTAGNWSKVISVPGLLPGLYWLELAADNKKQRIKLSRE